MRITALLLVAAMAILMMSGTVFAAIDGEGTEDDPFIISTVEDLMGLNEHYADIHDTYYPDFEDQFGEMGPFYHVSKSVTEFDLSEKEWVPVGTEMKPFTGSFYGNGIAISNLTLNASGTDNLGFFAFTDEAVISNVNFKDTYISGQSNAGVLAGTANNTNILYCSVVNGSVEAAENAGGLIGNYYAAASPFPIDLSGNLFFGSVSAEIESAGGLFGRFETNNAEYFNISNSVFNGTVVSESQAGGLIGYLINGGDSCISVLSGFAEGSVLSDTYSGGLIGNASITDGCLHINSSIVDVFVFSDTYSGGLIGNIEGIDPELDFNSNYVRGTIASESGFAGGLFGNVDISGISFANFCINSSTFEGHVSAGVINELEEFESVGDYAGGFIGSLTVDNTSLSLDSCMVFDSLILAGNYSGGIVGYYNGKESPMTIQSTQIYNSTVAGINNGNPLSGNYVGGYVGQAEIQSIGANSLNFMYNYPDGVKIVSTGNYSGGFIGQLNAENEATADFWQNRFVGEILSSGDYVGGYVGSFESYADDSKIYNSNFKGKISSIGDYVGGLIGYLDTNGASNSGIFYSYALADITSNNYAGGLVGYNGGEIDFSYFTGTLEGESNLGGFAGVNSGSINGSYSACTITNVTNTNIGRFIGDHSGTVDSSYAAGNIDNFIGNNADLNANCKTDFELKSNATFAGWDMYDFVFNGLDLDIYHDWVIAEGCFYPQLFDQHSYNQEPIEITKPEDFARIGTGEIADGKIWLLNVDYILNSSESDSKGRPVIDMAGVDFKPIGSEETPFTGNFDGNGHVIKNINYKFESADLEKDHIHYGSCTGLNDDDCLFKTVRAGLFGSVSHNIIENLVLENVLIGAEDGYVDYIEYTGSLAGMAD